jgi:hypothetical protein
VKDESPYPNLDFLIHGYFNEDFDLWGNDVQEIVSCFKNESDRTLHNLVIDEIDRFEKDHSANPDEYFDEIYGLYVDPEPWGHTAASLLEEVKRLLREQVVPTPSLPRNIGHSSSSDNPASRSSTARYTRSTISGPTLRSSSR